MKISDYILQMMENQGSSKAWVAEKTNIKYRTFLDKLEKNTFTAVELIKIGQILNLDLNKFKEMNFNDSK